MKRTVKLFNYHLTPKTVNPSMNIILASASPRRAQLLRQLGFDFKVHPSHIDEDLEGLRPVELVRTLAKDKALSVASEYDQGLVIGADTIVVFDNRILGKPADEKEALSMLSSLSGNTHLVYTGVSLADASTEEERNFVVETKVTFSTLECELIERYVATGSPMDKAGAYGIQDDWGSVFVERIEGDYYNVVGLPLNRLYRELDRFRPEVLRQIIIPIEN